MLTIERMYELAQRVAQQAPHHPACDVDDLVQCAVTGMVEAAVADEALAVTIARRRVIDEVRRLRGRSGTTVAAGRLAVHEATHLFRPLGDGSGMRLADLLPAEDDILARVESRLDALREAPILLRSVGRRAKHILIWHIVQERSFAEIALRYGVSETRIRQLTVAALARARAAHAARGRSVAPVPVTPRPARGDQDPQWYQPTAAEQRAFGEFRRLQRAGLRQQEALAALPESQRALVISYQRKSQRRARARATGMPVQVRPTRARTQATPPLDVTPQEQAAVRALWSLTNRGARWRDAVQALDPEQRALAAAYVAKTRHRARQRARPPA